jgi:hypothetical protein
VETGTRRRRARRLVVAGSLFAVFLWALVLLLAFTVESPAQVSRFDPRPLPPTAALDSPSRVDPLFSRVVSTLAGRKATVYCWSREDWAKKADEWTRRWPQLGELGAWRAYSFVHLGSVDVSPAICATLHQFVQLDRPAWRSRWPYALAWSVQVLAHESVHLRGIRSEVKADCFGMQSLAKTVVELGRSRAEGRYLAAMYWTHWYQWRSPEIRSPECRNGGSLDRSPSRVWP